MDLQNGTTSGQEVLSSPELIQKYGLRLTGKESGQAMTDAELARKHKIRILVSGDAEYPFEPGPGFVPPLVLFAYGTAVTGVGVCMVGSRAAPNWVVKLAMECAGELVREKMVVVSGGALGVDAAAHEGALTAGGHTRIFPGGGLLAPYPGRNIPLFERARARGSCLYSMFPLHAQPLRHTFVQRNALMARASIATAVLDASVVSGALHTARFATAAGRLVLSHPGSAGCNRLLQDGALPFMSGQELVSLVRQHETVGIGSVARTKRSPKGLLPEEIAQRSGNTLTEVFEKLQIGELNGDVIRLPGGRFLFLKHPE